MATFKDRMKTLRKARHLSQRALAEELGISKSAVGMYESGQREPDYESTEAIADFFNVDIDYLLGRSDVTTRLVDPVRTSVHPSWYDDPETAALAEKLRTNPDYRVLFDAVSDISPEDMQIVIDIVKRLGDRD